MRKYYLDNIRWSVIVLVLFSCGQHIRSCGAVMSYNAPGIPAMDAIGYLIYPWFYAASVCGQQYMRRFPSAKRAEGIYPGRGYGGCWCLLFSI